MNTSNRRHLLHVFSTFTVGGPQRRFANLIRKLGDRFTHSIVSMDDRWEAWDLLPEKPPVNPIDFTADKASSLKSIISARELLKAQQPDLLITYNWGAIEWGAANLLPICSHVHIEDGFRPDEVTARKKHRNLFRRLVLTSKSRVVVISETLKKIALKEWRLSPNRVEFIPNGVNIKRFKNPANPIERSAIGFSDQDLLIGTVAALRPEKNLGALIQSFAKLPAELNSKLVIGGAGPTRENLEKVTESLGLSDRVVFTGYTDNPENLYAAFDIFALSSSTEQMPLSVLEAMAAGLPIASFDVGDVAAMVAPSNLPYVVNRNEDALADALEVLASNTRLASQLGKENHQRAVNVYSEEVMVSEYERLFTENSAPQ